MMMWKIFKMQVTDIVTFIVAALLLYVIGSIVLWLIPIYVIYKSIEFIVELVRYSSSRD